MRDASLDGAQSTFPLHRTGNAHLTPAVGADTLPDVGGSQPAFTR